MSAARRTALVVGASSGIGAAVTRELARRALHVVGLGRRGDALRALADETGGDHAQIDVRSAEEVDRVIGETARRLGGVDVLVYASGILEVSPIQEHPVELWDEILAVNLRGAFLVTRATLPYVRAGGRLVFLSSVAATKGQPIQGAYAASKAGLTRFAESLSAEVEERGIGVHVVAPGPVATPMLDRPGTSGFQLEPEQVADIIAWLVDLPPDVVLRDVTVRATIRGPFARDRHAEDRDDQPAQPGH